MCIEKNELALMKPARCSAVLTVSGRDYAVILKHKSIVFDTELDSRFLVSQI